MAVLLQVGVRCRFCSKFRNPNEFIGDPRVAPCWNCFEWHRKAIEMLCGQPYDGVLVCQECGVTSQELMARSRNGDFPAKGMYLHPKDGIYQVLCKRCSDRYEAGRLDLYGDTPYGHLKGLKGAK